jgi:hypothetical protein
MKFLVIALLVIAFFIQCSGDNSIEPTVDYHKLYFERTVVAVYGDFVVIEAVDKINHPQLTELMWIDKDLRMNAPVDWHYYYSEKDKHVYRLSLWKGDYLIHLKMIVGR